MSAAVQFKVCGLRRPEDAQLATELGAGYLGFILYPKSLRYLSLTDYAHIADAVPRGPKRVAVMVEPSLADADWALEAGFDRVQIHARAELGVAQVRAWTECVGRDRLWLAPKLPPGAPFPVAWLDAADNFLVDTFHTEGFGGSGLTGDWTGFADLQAAHPQVQWILAGGLNPENVAKARAQSGARLLDVNSGVESAPGVKDAAKLRAWAAALVR